MILSVDGSVSPILNKVLEQHYERSEYDLLNQEGFSDGKIAQISKERLNTWSQAERNISFYKWAIPISAIAIPITLYFLLIKH